MAHPEMFDHNDPVLARVRSIALGFPGATEKISHGRPTFFTKKVFAYYGGAVRGDDGDWTQHPQSILLLLDMVERAALLEEARSFIPAYLGSAGWLGIDLSPSSDFVEVAELIDSSFRNTAPARLISVLDAPEGPGSPLHPAG